MLKEHPLANISTHSPQWFIRDIYFMNYHINHDKWDLLKYNTVPFAHRLEFDFCCFDPTCWTITATEQGSGTATEVCVDLVNGVLRITNDDNDADLDELVYGCECWKLVNCFPLYAEMRVRIDDPDLTSFWFGLVAGTSWWTVAPTDYVVFHIDAGGDDLEISSALAGAVTNVDTGRDLADNTWYILSFHWDGEGTIRWFLFTDAQEGGYCIATGTITTNISQAQEMAIGFGLRNDEAASHSMDIDYLYVVQKRVIE